LNPTEFLGHARRLGLPVRRVAAVVALSLFFALCEAAGIVFLLPIFQFIQADGDLARLKADKPLWSKLVDIYATLNLPLTLGTLLMTSFAFILCRQAVQFSQLVYQGFVRNNLLASIRVQMFDAFLKSELASVENEPTGRLVNEFTTEVENAAICITQFLQICTLAVLLVVYGAGLLWAAWHMTLIAAAIMLITAYLLRSMFGKALVAGEEITSANQEVGEFLVERLRALRLIRLSSTEHAERGQASWLLGHQRDRRQTAEKLNAHLTVAIEPVFVLLAFVFLWFANERLHMQLGEIGLFLIVVLRLLPLGKDIMRARQNLFQTLAGLNLILGRLDFLERLRESEGGTKVFSRLVEGIRFIGVSFSYPGSGSAAALHEIDLLVPAGRITALVGRSGAGKSTLVDLVPQLRVPTSGEIRFDSTPAAQFSRASLRARIAFVPQTPHMFNVSAADHIRYGNRDADSAKIREAARLAGALEFIEKLPDGFDTKLGEGGGRLSGGQRQRLDLARALVCDASILILDEPTSALDAQSEAAFREALQRIRRERQLTVMMIGHRLSTVALSDQIVVLDGGKIIDIGTHADLLARDGWYARAWAQQTTVEPAPAQT
jgi:ABC-type multidrug transport system fused ATPase/permease subunit